MTTILIVDDEYLVRKGIRETINWNDFGFRVIGEAVDGIDGFNKCMELKPDIIITDVHMKRSNGLEMIEKLKKTDGFDSEIVIISAYDDFEYVKKALENEVRSYILKPVQENELLSVMLRLKSELKEKRSSRKIMENALQQLPDMKNRFLKDVLIGRIRDENEIRSSFELYQIPIPENEYAVACIKLDDMVNVAENTKQLQSDMETALAYCSELTDNIPFVSCEISECNMALILFHYEDHKSMDLSGSPMIDFLSAVKEQFEVATGRTISIGYSNGHFDITEIDAAYREAKRALSYKSFVGNNSIIDYEIVPKVMNAALVMPYEDIERILDKINDDDYEGAKAILGSFFEKIKQDPTIDLDSLKDVVLEMAVMVLRMHFRNVDDIKKVYGYSIVPAQEVKKLENVNQIEEWITSVIKRIFDKPNKYEKNSYVNSVLELIADSYDQSLTVEGVAAQLHINPYYLMHLFKDTTGMTFNQYLTKIRIDKALELMKTQKYKVYEIAEMVGYKDAAYFSYIFKKTTGISPKQAMLQM